MALKLRIKLGDNMRWNPNDQDETLFLCPHSFLSLQQWKVKEETLITQHKEQISIAVLQLQLQTTSNLHNHISHKAFPVPK